MGKELWDGYARPERGHRSIYKPFSNIYIGEPVRGTSSSTQAKTKTKAKTRDATSNTTDAPSATTVPLIDPEPESASIPIDNRFLKVFRTLFNPAVTSSPGEIPWNYFLHAMTSTGLFGAEKLYGSVWQFQKLAGDQSKIQFHEPHPRGKMAFTKARRVRRRLNRAFGWAGDTFVLREK